MNIYPSLLKTEGKLFPPLINQNAYICVELYDGYTYIWNNLKNHLGILQTKDWQTDLWGKSSHTHLFK